jgi:hypothetical protein
MIVELISPLVRLFREGVERYQPVFPGVELEEENGDPGVSTRNMGKLLEGDLFVNHIILRAGKDGNFRALLLLSGGLLYLSLGFGLRDPTRREALTRFAVRLGYGHYEPLKKFYDAIPDDFEGTLPSILPHPSLHGHEQN